MNWSQFASFAKTLLGATGAVMISHGVNSGVANALTGDTALSFYSGLVVVVAPLVWGWFAHTPLGNALTAANTPGVTVKVGPDAPAELKAAAADPTIPAITRAPN